MTETKTFEQIYKEHKANIKRNGQKEIDFIKNINKEWLEQKRLTLWKKHLTFTEWTLSAIVEENAQQIRFIDKLLEELKQ